ncbi:MAG: hypothetical protein LJE83_10655 [Gammaproteobacteria bacterium]|nr:hypothetical protein [Gammaproteobacteria bacterium]
MSYCCSTSCDTDINPKRHRCPVNGQEYKEVSAKTVLHHIKEPWAWEDKHQAYYFCDDPDCDVVYFGQDNSTIKTIALRTTVGIKEKNQNSTLCYCFGVSLASAKDNSKIMHFVTEKTKSGVCACETRNPSGKCCLQDFPKQ